MDQAGKKSAALNHYRRIIEAAWKTEKDRIETFGSHWSLAEEAIGYAKPLLDPKNDAEELQRYEARAQTLMAKPRSKTPIIVPLGEKTDLSSVVDPYARVQFDLDGRGHSVAGCRWEWIRGDAAFLVWDPLHKGVITSGLQFFGGVSWWLFWPDGYAPLAALDDDGNGWLEGNELDGLAFWRDADGNGVSDAGEVTALNVAGVTGVRVFPDRGKDGALSARGGVRFRDGSLKPSYDWVANCR